MTTGPLAKAEINLDLQSRNSMQVILRVPGCQQLHQLDSSCFRPQMCGLPVRNKVSESFNRLAIIGM